MDIIIREERTEDWYDTEYVAKRAFWNLHHPGCDEHYLVHKLRSDSAYIPELSRLAVPFPLFLNYILIISQSDIFPLPLFPADDEDNSTNILIESHSDPDTDKSEMTYNAKEKSKS